MSGALEELERLSLEARSKKGRMDADSRKQAAALLHMIWTDAEHDPAATFPYLADLKAEALADAIAQSWTKLDDDRRALFERWLPPPVTERDIRRLAFLAGSVIEIDPSAGIRWLIRIVPSDRKSPTKETRQHLAAGLLDTNIGFHNLAKAPVEAGEIFRIYRVLWEIAIDPAFAVPVMARVRLARAIFAFAKATDGTGTRSAFEHLKSQIRAEAGAWPASLRSEFDRVEEDRQEQPSAEINVPNSSRDMHPQTHAPDPPAPATAVATRSNQSSDDVASGGDVGRGTQSPGESGPPVSASSSEDLASQIDQWIAHIPLELELLRRLQALVKQHISEKHAHNQLAEQLAEAGRVLGEVRSTLDAANRDLNLSRDEIQREKLRADELEAKLTRAAQDTEDERRRLGQQISANASGRIEEFKNRLGSSLSRLVTDLPSARTDVSPELGRVLLLQFHQFLEALRQEGISVRPGANSQ